MRGAAPSAWEAEGSSEVNDRSDAVAIGDTHALECRRDGALVCQIDAHAFVGRWRGLWAILLSPTSLKRPASSLTTAEPMKPLLPVMMTVSFGSAIGSAVQECDRRYLTRAAPPRTNTTMTRSPIAAAPPCIQFIPSIMASTIAPP